MNQNVVLIHSGGQKFQFPVNPESFNIAREKGYETLTILNNGEFDLPQGPRIKQFSFSSFFPAVFDPSYCTCAESELLKPEEATNLINELMLLKKPVRLIVTGTGINQLVSVSSHHTTYKGGEPEDIFFEVSFREWRVLKTLQNKNSKTLGTKAREDAKDKQKVYVVKPGDSLFKISKTELGDSSKWTEIFELNKKLIGVDPNKIKLGQKLVMP